jgi:hypothetical protein
MPQGKVDWRWLLIRVGLLLACLMAVGCGHSDSDPAQSAVAGSNQAATSKTGEFVVTEGDGVELAPTGSLTYSFVRGQSSMAVPQNTADLRFEFFDGPDGTGNPTQEAQLREFAATVTIAPVLTTTHSTVVTALTDEGVPLLDAVANITVTPGGNTLVAFAQTTVTESIPVQLVLGPANRTREVGTDLQYTATVSYSDGSTVDNPEGVQFSASGPATIDATSGLATASDSTGSATITASLGDLSDSVTLQVIEDPTPVLVRMLMGPRDITVKVGATRSFECAGEDQFGDRIFPEDLPKIHWTSSNTEVAVIEADRSYGICTATGEGETTITVESGGVSTSTTLTVDNAYEPPTTGGGATLQNGTQLTRRVPVYPYSHPYR